MIKNLASVDITAILFCLCCILPASALGQMPSGYELIEKDGHKIHLLKIDPKKYEMKIVSALDSVFGREKLDSIAGRVGASIAVNAGFFEIGGDQDGMPSGGVGIDGLIFGIHSKKLATIIKNGSETSIKPIAMKVSVKIGGQDYTISAVNKFARSGKPHLYSSAWGDTTLTRYDNRTEISIDHEGTIIEVSDHGNSDIPEGGYVVSLGSAENSISKKEELLGKKARLNFSPSWLNNAKYSFLMGVPMLIRNGKIMKDVTSNEPNARTAFGVTKNGHYVVAVVEHVNLQDLKNITLMEVKALLKEKDLLKKDIKMSELKSVLKQEAEKKSGIRGLGLKDLAKFMKDQGCVAAVNLDGGGSSSMYIDGKYVNQAFGDIDENQGIQTHRALANAIVFVER